jgi:twitching motility protein PilJ
LQDKAFVRSASTLAVLSQEIAKNVSRVTYGSDGVFTSLEQESIELDRHIRDLREGNPAESLPRAPDEIVPGLEEISVNWETMKVDIQFILANRQSLMSVQDLTTDLIISMSAIQQENTQVVASLLKQKAAANQVALAQRQELIIERITRSVEKLLEIGNTSVLVENINRDKQSFQKVLDGLVKGDRELLLRAVSDSASLSSLSKINELFSSVSNRLSEMIALSADNGDVAASVAKVLVASETILNQSNDLLQSYERYAASRIASTTTGLILGLLAGVLLLLITVLLYRESALTVEEAAAQNEINQAAILQLLDELADFSDGDLTTQATVTESFTGAIADSINFSIDQTREIVSTINQTATQVSEAAVETQQSVAVLEQASEVQAREIADVSTAVDDMAVSIDRVSYNAAESTSVAERSLDIASNGAEVVQNTINGMGKIRGQIQETAKRIKRLGESSQEIGDIVNLINDIADQTNILSLNAAIQASMAGEAGRGFAVVADEVQRLAERSGAAAKQIAALVKTIQTDTNEAVISMEQTTSEVVQGARLAQDAGVALDEIEGVSKSLAEIIDKISDSARQQAVSAGKISNTMKSIQEITDQTTDGTSKIVESVGNFAEMTNELRSSVSGFKLPEN